VPVAQRLGAGASTRLGDGVSSRAPAATANQEFGKGDQDAAANKPSSAIDHYKHAREHAQKA
jgi:hypothetical protein